MRKSILFVAICMAMLVKAEQKPLYVFTFGDTSMSNRDVEVSEERGWGQVLPTYFSAWVTVENLAQENTSTKSVREDSVWQKQLDKITRGSYVVLQYSDYDIKQNEADLHTSVVEYAENLEQMVKDIKKKKAIAIICTPPARYHYSRQTGNLVERHGAYVDAARHVAKHNKLTLIDLSEKTFAWLSALTPEEAAEYFIAQDSETADNDLRLTEAGALQVAKFAAEELQANKVKKLSAEVLPNSTEIKYAK